MTAWSLSNGGSVHATASSVEIAATFGELERSVTTSTVEAKPDYAGTIYDVVSLAVRSPTADLSEGDAVRLSAAGIGDDGTEVDATAETVWSVESGPLAETGGGWFTAQPVYRDSNALARASALGRTASAPILVLNSNPDNFGLYGADDIDDGWQVQHFGIENVAGARAEDPDHDSADNYYEFTAGTDPNAASDSFDLAIRRSTVADVGLGPVTTGRIYRIQSATNLLASDWRPVTNVSVAAPQPLLFVSDPYSTNRATFYRVAIEYPWRAEP